MSNRASILSIWNRKKQKGELEEGLGLIKRSALRMSDCAQYVNSAELGSLYCDQSAAASRPFDLDFVKVLGEALPPSASQLDFLSRAISWSKSEASPGGHPEVRHVAATSAWAQGKYPVACAHYVYANSPEEYADMMAAMASDAYASERDLLLARGVLSLLAVGNLRDGNVFRDVFLARVPSSGAPTPLMNFIRFLLLTLERDALPLFKALSDSYKPAIDRDPSLAPLVAGVGKAFYNYSGPPGMMEMMASMLGLGGGGASGAAAPRRG